ncbi:MAG TPA: hypothetical protein VHQ22_02130 [Terriglobales bacterium]|jgi:hypothetical protein|nr:hypothetical protein [Terriglobales bacterium]
MTATSDPRLVLSELAFELKEGVGPRFLIAVCDDKERAANLRNKLDTELMGVDKEPVVIGVPLSSGNLVDAILYKTESRNPSVIHLVQEKDLPDVGTEKFFGELNFQRDSLSKLSAPFILWLYGRQIAQLAAKAPDFWSRRTAIFYFDSPSFTVLLDQIFKGFKTSERVQADEISGALRDILSSERELEKCLMNRRHFSLPRADSFIKKLRTNIQKLVTECSKGRKLDVVLWMWNAGHLDIALGRFGPPTRTPTQTTLLERNDLLLSLAEHIEKVLRQYLVQMEQKIRTKESLSLVQVFTRYALNLWAQMTRQSRKGIENIHQLDIEDIRESEFARGDTFSALLIDSFESWLSGANDNKPPAITEEEAQVLKYLYLRQSDNPVSAPVPPAQIKQLIPALRTKVRLLLGDVPF